MLKDYWIILKPELTLLSVFTAVMSCYIAIPVGTDFVIKYNYLINVIISTFLLGGCAAILNQLIEKKYDSIMKRTEGRPLVNNNISTRVGWIYATVLGISGTLFSFYNLSIISFLAAIGTVISYIIIYTPFKRISVFSTIIGAIPGALPPVIGWTAVTNRIDQGAWIVFTILFLWQIPHFYSLGWLYRKDYKLADYKILPVTDSTGKSLGGQILFNMFALFPVSLMPAVIPFVSIEYFYIMLIIGPVFIYYGIKFSLYVISYKVEDIAIVNKNARKLFYSGLIYLPTVFFLMAFYKI